MKDRLQLGSCLVANRGRFSAFKLYLGCFLLLFLLSPYLFIGGLFVHGGLLSVVMLFAISWKILPRVIPHRETFMLLGLFAIVVIFHLVGTLIAVIAGAGLDTVFLILLVRVLVYFMCGVILAGELQKRNFTSVNAVELLIKLLVFVVFVNSVIILLEFSIPSLKTLIESILYYDEGMNINYRDHSFRMRGVASAGGASLSVFHAVGVLGTIWLFLRKRMDALTMICVAAIVVASLLIIGRTGLIIIAVVGCALVFVIGFKRFGYIRIRPMFVLMISLFIVVTLPAMASNWLSQGIYEYSVGFLYGGLGAIADEGTASTIISFFHFPANVGEIFYGAGNFSGAFEEGISTDSGYMKTFTALGLPVSVFLYFTVPFLLFRNIKRVEIDSDVKALLFSLILAIAISEVKEPFLLQGYTARFFWLISGCCAVYASAHPQRTNLLYRKDFKTEFDQNSTRKALYKR